MPPASRASCSASAFVREYSALEPVRSGADSSTSTSGCPSSSAASVPTWTKRGVPTSFAARTALPVPATLTRSKSSGLPQSPSCAAQWKNDVRAGGAVAQRAHVVEIALDRLGAEPADRLRAAFGAGERADGPALVHEPPRERAADEARSAGDEGGAHRNRDATSSAGKRPCRTIAYSPVFA